MWGLTCSAVQRQRVEVQATYLSPGFRHACLPNPKHQHPTLLFPFAATFNPLLRFVYHLPVKASNNTQQTQVSQTTINTTGRPGIGAYCASPSPFIDARVAPRITLHLHVSIQCETNNQIVLQRRQASKLTITISQPDQPCLLTRDTTRSSWTTESTRTST